MQRVRYGIIGYGLFAEKTIAPAIKASENSELVAIQKRSKEAAQAKARELGIKHAFDSVEALVNHPDVDAVFIVSANSAHCPETLAAARARKHVLVEKPMAMSVEEAEQMIDACRSGGVKLMVGHMLRFSPLLTRMRDLMRSGALGTPVSARADFVYDASVSHRGWLYDRKVAGGGPIFDIGVHCLDSLRFVLDDEVQETSSLLAPEPTESRTESTATIQMRFSKGTLGSIFCSYAVPLRRTFIEIIGSEGAVSAFNFTLGGRTTPLSIVRGGAGQASDERVEQITIPNLYIEEVSHFSDCITNEREPLLSGENGLKNQVVLDVAMHRRRKS